MPAISVVAPIILSAFGVALAIWKERKDRPKLVFVMKASWFINDEMQDGGPDKSTQGISVTITNRGAPLTIKTIRCDYLARFKGGIEKPLSLPLNVGKKIERGEALFKAMEIPGSITPLRINQVVAIDSGKREYHASSREIESLMWSVRNMWKAADSA
jgi:hypothetical protein